MHILILDQDDDDFFYFFKVKNTMVMVSPDFIMKKKSIIKNVRFLKRKPFDHICKAVLLKCYIIDKFCLPNQVVQPT